MDRRSLICILAVVLLSAALFAPALGFNFINLDDPYLVQNNASLLKPLSLPALLAPVAGLYHPLTNLTYWIDARIAGLNPWIFHLTGIVFHLLGTVALFIWVRRLTGSVMASGLLAAAFAWHPTHLESVVWISERKDVVSVFFFWACLAAHSGGRLWLSAGFALLSLMGKPFALMLPLVLVWIELWKAGFDRRSVLVIVWRQRLFYLLLSAFSLMGGLMVLRSQGAIRAQSALDWAELAVRLPQQLLFYLHKTVWPFDLQLVYSREGLLPGWPAFLFSVAAVLVTLFMSWRSKEFRRNLIFGTGFFLLTIFPMLKLVPFGDDSLVADRYLYVAQTGLLWPWAIHLKAGRRWLWAAPVLIFWYVASVQRLPDWKDSVSIWQSLLRIHPESSVAHENLGRYYLGAEKHELALSHMVKGKTETWDNQHNQAFLLMRLNRLQEADEKLRFAEARAPNDPKVLNLRGNLFLESGQSELAESYFRKSLASHSSLLQELVRAEALSNLGVVALRRSQARECIRYQNQALAALPEYVYAVHNRAVCYYNLKEYAMAKADYERTLMLQPSFAMAHNGLGAIALTHGELDPAERHFREALKHEPGLQVAKDNLERVLRRKAGRH